jgi:L-threonylcarbamoyladenylate synthase
MHDKGFGLHSGNGLVSPDFARGRCVRKDVEVTTPHAQIQRADQAGIDAAVAVLRQGGLVVLPTETVYGLGADATSELAVARIFQVKGRPADHPVIVHVLGVDDLDVWAVDVPSYARELAQRWWPGPMTLVLTRRPGVGEIAAGGAPTIALRSPSHPVARAVIEQLGSGVAAPSANRFGRVSPTTAHHVVEELGDVLTSSDLILDGGECVIGVESTIIDCTGAEPIVLRPGGVTNADIAQVVALSSHTVSDLERDIRAPGTLAAHYAPTARVLLAEEAEADEVINAAPAGEVGLLSMVTFEPSTDRAIHRLVAPGNVDEYAQDLYAALRRADQLGLVAVVAVLPPVEGIGVAVRDRLQRAATGSAV